MTQSFYHFQALHARFGQNGHFEMDNEFHSNFELCDMNGDGYVSRFEFNRCDTGYANRYSETATGINWNDYRDYRSSYDWCDSNRDGRVSRSEFARCGRYPAQNGRFDGRFDWATDADSMPSGRFSY